MTYNNNTYYYVRNIMGDIIGITDANGNLLVTYTYDPYGNLIGFDYDTNEGWEVGYLNPFRFKGYYFDNETGFYYCNSRYYDPELCRFLNADGYVSTGQGLTGLNMFAYCGNNPVNRKDPSGQGWLGVLKVIVVVVVAVIIVNEVKDAIIDSQKGVNDEEKEVAKKDPIGAIKGAEARKIANEYQQKLYPNTCDVDDNQANAFKHMMWNAVMTDKIGAERAKKFADAHEAPYLNTQPRSSQMDLFNNELGRQIAVKYAGQGYDVFAQKIQEVISGGEADVIKWDEGN